MAPILSLLKYSYTNRRSLALVIFSVLVAIWVLGWTFLLTIGFLFVEPSETGGPVGFLASVCAWFILVMMFCALPLAVQLAWAARVYKQEADEAARAAQYRYSTPGAPAYPPAQYAQYPPPAAAAVYPPPASAAGYPAPDPRLEEEKRKSRDLEYENALLRRRLKEEEARRIARPTAEKLVEAQGLEMERRYDDAIRAYEELGRWDDAARVRMLSGKGGTL
jgi:hypothetical protein